MGRRLAGWLKSLSFGAALIWNWTPLQKSFFSFAVLVWRNNAGIMGCPFKLSKDGIELQFATNHVGKNDAWTLVRCKFVTYFLSICWILLTSTGHFLLTNLLLDKMKSTARKTGVQGRIVNVSSIAHKRSDGSCFDLNKLNDKSRSAMCSFLLLPRTLSQCKYLKVLFLSCSEIYRYKPLIAYAHSKLANILHANELAKRFQVHIFLAFSRLSCSWWLMTLIVEERIRVSENVEKPD